MPPSHIQGFSTQLLDDYRNPGLEVIFPQYSALLFRPDAREQRRAIHDIAYLVNALSRDAFVMQVLRSRIRRSRQQIGGVVGEHTVYLFISSGMARLKERNPASMCATGIRSLTAAKVPARVELVSP